MKDNEIFWRFHSVTEEQVRGVMEPKKIQEEIKHAKIEAKQEETKPKIESKEEIKPETEVKQEPAKEEGKQEEKKPVEFKKEKAAKVEKTKKPEKKTPLLDTGIKIEAEKTAEIKSKEKSLKLEVEKKPKEKSEFVLRIVDFLKSQKIELIEEKELKKKEFSGVVRIDTMLGKINFLCNAKDKKSITENDLRLALQESQALMMPAIVIYQSEPNKKTLEYAEKLSSLIKLKKLE